jgi:biopolymer transport protein ExbB/TolQ
MDFAKIWHDTGTLNKGIVIFLALMSVVSLSVAVTKWLRFRKMARATRAFAPVFSQALENDNIPEALAAADQYPGSHVARVLGESLREVAPLLEDPPGPRRRRRDRELRALRGARADPSGERPEERHGPARHHRRHRALRGAAGHHARHRARLHGHG